MARSCSARLHGDAAAFSAALRSLLNNPQFSDVTFVVGRERREVFAHRCVLACRCQAFRGMLSAAGGPAPRAPLVLGNVQPDVFLAVIEFLYTNCVTLDSHIAAVTYGQGDLQQHCLAFIEDLVRTRGFQELSDAVLARVLRSDRLAVDELELVQAVREWAHVSSAVLERPVPEVAALPVRELRLPLLAPSELATLESHNQRDLLIPAESITAAWRCHALRRGSGVPARLCRPRRGTRPREHHRHLDPHGK
uniref:BTB domain containing 19 n=1 Tax=Nothoprocta perdicaria TaxID=30464 RepID=A0A8C6ZYE8_NOTPE